MMPIVLCLGDKIILIVRCLGDKIILIVMCLGNKIILIVMCLGDKIYFRKFVPLSVTIKIVPVNDGLFGHIAIACTAFLACVGLRYAMRI